VGFLADAFLMIGGATALVVAAKILLPRILRESLRGRRMEVGMLVGIASALATAVVAQAIGFSLEMGAFLAGFVLAGTPFRHQLSGQIGPLRDIFSALFFTTIGMKLDPAALIDSWSMILLAVLVLITLKSLVISGVCWSVGALAANAIIVGLSLAQAGEFSLILIQEASDLEIIAAEVVPNAIAVVVISLILTPALAEIGRRLGRAASRFGHAPWIKSLFGDAADHVPSDVDGIQHVIIGGFGPVGRRVAEELEATGISYTVIELNPDTVVEQLRHRRSMVFGDVGNAKVLESAGIGHADVLVLTIPDEDAVLRACDVARRRAPKIYIAARTALVTKGNAASEIGADHVTVDEMATAEAMCLVVRKRLAPDAPVADAIESDEAIESPDTNEEAT
jgi:CPA2 family monovalent cation:H+ antiporter-2